MTNLDIRDYVLSRFFVPYCGWKFYYTFQPLENGCATRDVLTHNRLMAALIAELTRHGYTMRELNEAQRLVKTAKRFYAVHKSRTWSDAFIAHLVETLVARARQQKQKTMEVL